MTPTIQTVHEYLRNLAETDRVISAAEARRRSLTGPLESAAETWYARGQSPKAKACTRCSFEYDGPVGERDITGVTKHLRFTTTCTWCSDGEGEGLVLPIGYIQDQLNPRVPFDSLEQLAAWARELKLSRPEDHGNFVDGVRDMGERLEETLKSIKEEDA